MTAFSPSTQRIWYSAVFALFSVLSAYCQQPTRPNQNVPVELRAADPEVSLLLDAAQSDSDLGNFDAALSKLRTALEVATKKEFVGDKAIAEANLAGAYFALGKIDDALGLYRVSLEDSVAAANFVLQADVLVTLSTLPQLQGNLPAASELLTKALDRANQSKNLLIRSRVLGELGRVQLISGQVDNGRKSIEEALNIDRTNGYGYEPLHSVYAAYAVLAEPNPDLARAIAQLESAGDLAVQKANYLAFVLAENTLGAIYVRSGNPQKGVATLEATRNGNILKDGQIQQLSEPFRAAATLPFMKATLLEALAQGYESAQEVDKAFQAWNELYSLSAETGLKVTEAEAASRIAEIYNGKSDISKALEFFSKSIETWRSVGNDEQLSQALIAESQLLIQTGKGEDAVPLEGEILNLAEKNRNRQLQFSTQMILAEIYQPEGKSQEARSVLEKAQALIRPGPADSDIDGKLVLETYIRIADVYKVLQLPIKELVAIEKAISVLQNLKDDQSLQQEIAYMRGRMEALRVQELATNAAKAGELADSLWYSEILYIWNGTLSDPSQDENWSRVLNLPARVAEEPEGAHVLGEIVDQVGPLLGIANLPLLNTLSNHFLAVDVKPDLAERYAKEAESVVKQRPNPSEILLVMPVCQLTKAYAQEGKKDLARQEAAECKAVAERTNDVQSTNLANAAITSAQIAVGDLTSALASLKNFLASNPDNPELHSEVASGLAGAKVYKDAIEEFRRAILLYERKGDANAAANTYTRMAFLLGAADSTEYRNVQLDSLKSAEALYHEAKNLDSEASTKLNIGSYYVSSGDSKSALSYFQAADLLAQQAHDTALPARTAWMLGNAYNTLRDYRAASQFHRRAATAFRQMGNRENEAWNLMDLCQDIDADQDYDNAFKTCRDAEEVADPFSQIQYGVQKTLGDIYYQQGELEKALSAAEKAARLASDAGYQQESANAYLQAAGLYEVLGQWEDAATAVDKALTIFKSTHNKNGEAFADAELAEVYGDRNSSIKDYDKAMAYDSAATELDPDKFIFDEELYLGMGNFSKAILASQAGIKACATVAAKAAKAECQGGWLISLSEAERKSGDVRASGLSLKEASSLAANSKDVYLQGRLLYGKAGQARAEGHLGEAFQSFKELISLVETVKGAGDLKQQRSVSETYGFIYDEMVSALYEMSAGKSEIEKARLASLGLEYAETNKARQFSQSWGRTFSTELRRILPVDVQEKERSLVAKRDQLRMQLSTSPSEAQGNRVSDSQQLKSDLASVEKEVGSLMNGLRQTQPQYAAVAYPEPITLESLPLRNAEILVECKVTDDATFVWIAKKLTGSKIGLLAFYEVRRPRQWFVERISKLRDALNRAQPEGADWRLSEELFNALFPEQFSKILLESKSIVFIPDDALSVLPFELLSPEASKEHFPLLSIPTTYYPSAAALRLARTAGHAESWPEAFLGIGDPITSPDDERYQIAGVLSAKRGAAPGSTVNSTVSELGAMNLAKIQSRGFTFERLPGTAVEIRGIATLFQKQGQTVEVRLGSDATKDRLADTDLTRFRFLHFATHGILPVDSNIKEPALVLSYDGSSPEQMFLSMSEILGLKIHAETVVLSACNTGSGAVSHAEGVMSLGRAFMAAGAESVTVSLWQVSDESTQMLMEEYYKNILQGKSKAEALAIARSYLFASDKRFTNPFFWAPFVLIGD